MAMVVASTTSNGIAPTRAQQDNLLDELLELYQAILDGERPQYKLSDPTLAQIRSALDGERIAEQQAAPSQPSIPGLALGGSGLDPIFLQKSDSLIRAEGALKRQRLEQKLSEQVEKSKHTLGGRDGPPSVDVDNVLAQAQILTPPVSGLSTVVPAVPDEKSSFDENDYYSSQVESEWSANGVPVDASQGFTADYARFDVAANPAKRRRRNSTHAKTVDNTAPDQAMEDDYIPEEPEQTPPENEDYEPGEVTQLSDEYTPEYAPPPVASPETRIAHNQLTHLAAPQPNRVSPLAVHKGQNYELELVNGRPEVVKKARSRYDTDARQSSASPPAGNRMKKQKNKKRKRDDQPVGRSKKRDRRLGLDTSAQYPAAIKDEPVSPPSYIQPQKYEYKVVEPMAPPQGYAQRASSVMTHRVVPEQDPRRIATLHQPEYRPYSPVAPYVPARQIMGPPPPRLQEYIPDAMPPPRIQEYIPDAMPPPPAPKRVVVDQYGNRYYAAEPEPPRTAMIPEPYQYERAPSRMSAAPPQYDPANARIEYLPPPRVAATPSYAFDDGRMQKMRPETRYAAEPTSPVFERRVQYDPFAPQEMPPPAFRMVDPGRQTMAPPQYYAPEQPATVARPYSVQPEFVQQMPMALAPRQGSVAPVQYIRQSVQPEQSVRYIDQRGFEIQPSQLRQVSEYRQY